MKAIVKTKKEFGIELLDVDKPSVGETDILVKTAYGSLCGSDVHIYEWTSAYEHYAAVPLILGHEFSGEVVEVGSKVGAVAPGDRISAIPSTPCSVCDRCVVGRGDLCANTQAPGMRTDGFFAEYGRLSAGTTIFKLPDSISYESAAVLEPFCVSLNAIDISDFKMGQKVAVLGPGPIGLFATLLLRAGGAGLIIMAGTSGDTRRFELAEKCGADVIVDVEKEDPVRKVTEITGTGAKFGLDIVFEATGNPKSISQALDMLKPGGKLVMIGIHSGPAEFDPTWAVRQRKSLIGSYIYTPDTWRRAIALMASGRVDVEPVITHRLPLERAEEGFQLALKKEAGKILFAPNPDIV
jgi:2-desacetyl-2-hydroxyethyl bacteriochlorophyllide A dehydrogenase